MTPPSPLISAEDLRALLGTAPVTLLDVRWQLGRTDGLELFLAGHVPGAGYVDLETDLADPARPGGSGGRHPLPAVERFEAAMRRVGVSADTPVVVYDDASALAATRCWWLLVHHGHRDVRVLDGGYAAWVAAGGDVETGQVVAPEGSFTAGPGVLPVADAEEAAAIATDGVLLDARAPERFRGETEPIDPVAGHIPGAVNLPATANLADGRFVDVATLEETYEDVVGAAEEGRPVGASCGSGVYATHDLFALTLLGVTGSLYAGSWSDWVSDPSRPVETGG